ncbi:MAG: hypothetical protein IPI31_02700 [Bacteroidetes bacterium]|nr:hypothetical protein [Bacteroidota bacterium]
MILSLRTDGVLCVVLQVPYKIVDGEKHFGTAGETFDLLIPVSEFNW